MLRELKDAAEVAYRPKLLPSEQPVEKRLLREAAREGLHGDQSGWYVTLKIPARHRPVCPPMPGDFLHKEARKFAVGLSRR